MRFSVSEAEHEEIKKKAALANLTEAEYIRSALREVRLVEAPPADYNRLIAEFKDVGSLLDRVIKKLSFQGIYDTAALKEALEKNWEAEQLLRKTFQQGGKK